jgi:hypothetical protein
MSRRKWLLPGCALLAVVVVLAIIASVPAALALRLAGFRSQGSTEGILAERGAAPPTIAWWPLGGSADPGATGGDEQGAGGDVWPVTGPETLDAITVDLWFLAEPRTLPWDPVGDERLERGQTQAGETAYYIQFDEESANTQLIQWFGDAIEEQTRLRNPWIDLRPGGAVVYADVDLEIGWKRVGAVVMVDASGRQIEVIGVDIDGRLYSTPPDGQIAELAERVEFEANRALRELTFIDPAGQLTIQTISVSEDLAQILAY